VVVKNLIIATHEHEPVKGAFSDLRIALETLADAVKIDSKDAIRTQGRIIAEIIATMLYKHFQKNYNKSLTLDQHLKELKTVMLDSAGKKLHNLLNAIRYSCNAAVHFSGNSIPANKADTLYCLSAVFDAVLTLFHLLELPKPQEIPHAKQPLFNLVANPNVIPHAKQPPYNPAFNPTNNLLPYNNPIANQHAQNNPRPIQNVFNPPQTKPAAVQINPHAGQHSPGKHKNYSDTPTKMLYVTGVDPSLSDSTLACYFASIDEIDSCQIKRKEGKNLYHAFVNFKSIEGAIAARNRFHNSAFPGTTSVLNISFRKI